MAGVLNILILTVTLVVLTSARDVRYCQVATCDKPKEDIKPLDHVACKYTETDAGKSCNKITSTGLTGKEKDEILRVHNDYRQRVKEGLEKRGNPGPQPPAKIMNTLEWDDELAKLAQMWANQCNYNEHDKCRDTPNMRVGQNMVWTAVMGKEEKTLTYMMNTWIDEVNDFNRNDVKSFKSTPSGHYTQMVWAETTKIGCGLTRFITKQRFPQGVFDVENKFLVCNYAPAGNMLGGAIY